MYSGFVNASSSKRLHYMLVTAETAAREAMRPAITPPTTVSLTPAVVRGSAREGTAGRGGAGWPVSASQS